MKSQLNNKELNKLLMSKMKKTPNGDLVFRGTPSAADRIRYSKDRKPYPIIMFCEQDKLEDKYEKAVKKLCKLHKHLDAAKKKEHKRKNNTGPEGKIWKEYWKALKATKKYRVEFLELLQKVVYYQQHDDEIESNDD